MVGFSVSEAVLEVRVADEGGEAGDESEQAVVLLHIFINRWVAGINYIEG